MNLTHIQNPTNGQGLLNDTFTDIKEVDQLLYMYTTSLYSIWCNRFRFDRFTSDVAVLLIQQKNLTNFHLLKNNLVYKLMFNNNDNNNNKIIIINFKIIIIIILIIIIIIICKHIRLQLKKLDHNFSTNILGYPHARTHTRAHTHTHTIHKSGRLNWY